MKLVIEGVPPYDGEYDIADGQSFTNREMHRIKVLSGEQGGDGLRGGEVFEALVAYDIAAYVAVAAVMLERTGIVVDTDLLWNGESGSLYINASSNGADPLAPERSTGEPSEPTENEPASGEPSTSAGE